jgi:hypothetical protein
LIFRIVIDVSMLGNVKTLILHRCNGIKNLSKLKAVEYLDINGIKTLDHGLPLDNMVKHLHFEYSTIITEDAGSYLDQAKKTLTVFYNEKVNLKKFEGFKKVIVVRSSDHGPYHF